MVKKQALSQNQENQFSDFNNGITEKTFGALDEQQTDEPKVEVRIPEVKKIEKAEIREQEDENTAAIYPYKNLGGTVSYEIIRRTGSGEPFLIRHKDEKGKYIYKRPKNVNLIPYNLPNVRKAIEQGTPVWLTEGESKADTLNTLGFTATTCAFKGTDKWYNFYNKDIEGVKSLFLLIDNDEDSEEFANATSNTILRENETVSIYPIRINEICSNLEIGADIDDLIDKVGTETVKATLETIESTYA